VARVGNAVLYETDLIGIFKPGIKPDDSINIRTIFIDNWVKEEVLFQQAEASLSDSLKNKEQELKDYYRSLIRHAYEQELVNRQLDTTVTVQDIEAYYKKYQGNFELKRTVCRARYILLNADAPKVEKVKEWFAELNADFLDSLDGYCLTYSINYQIDQHKWKYKNDVRADIKMDEETFSSWSALNNTYFMADSLKIVLYQPLEVRNQGELAPLSLEAPRIRSLIQHKKKIAFLESLEKKILDDAQKNGEIEINY
ncbi:MAG: hypothetical protein KDC92_17460, partial [Bacteroidetes bacterium]|nr:hypothetical protein [Bacteroidota bacterium]